MAKENKSNDNKINDSLKKKAIENNKLINDENKQEIEKEKQEKINSETKLEAKPLLEEQKPAEAPSPNTEKKAEQKPEAKPLKPTKKSEAVAISDNARISKKHSMFICRFIKNKPIDLAIEQLQEVLKFKRAIPFKGEIPHRHSLGGKSGRYPINASKEFINILKSLKGNCIVNQIELEKTRIYFASASWASRSAKRGGARFKRCHIILKAKEFPVKHETGGKK